MEDIKGFLKPFFSAQGRMKRREYIVGTGWLFLAVIVAFFGLALLTSVPALRALGVVAFAGMFLASFWAGFVLCIKRFHDLNLSGWLSILTLVPYINLIVFAILFLKKGTEGHNKYGVIS